MTVYIVHLEGHSDFNGVYTDFNGVYTDLTTAQQACYICNEKALFSYWTITPIELTTDSFMESVLTNKDSK